MSEKAVRIPEAVVSGIKSASNVVLLTHVHPDGDAIGSSLGFADILEAMGKKVFIFLEEPVSVHYAFLPGIGRVETSIEKLQGFVDECGGNVIAVALDSGDDSRLGKFRHDLLRLTPFMVIDHHKSHRDFGEYRWVEPGLSSTGEMVYELAQALETEITLAAARCLYVAICTDTGSFRYESTSPRTLQIAAELVAMGVRPEEIAKCLYDNVSLARLHLLRLVLGTLQVYEDNRLACIHVTREMLLESGASIRDVEGFIDIPRSLGTAKVAIFLKESDDGQISVSLRAKGECDVAEVAGKFQGGGHRNAAGFRYQGGSLEDVRTLVLAELRQKL